MALPAVLKNFNLTVDGVGYLGQCDEVTPPKLKIKTESHRSGGMLGEIDIDMGYDKLEMEFSIPGWAKDLLKNLGHKEHDKTALRFNGACEADDNSKTMAVQITARGRLVEWDADKAKAGDKAQHKYKYAISYYKLEVDGETVIELDLVNLVHVVHGVDRLAERRKALGI